MGTFLVLYCSSCNTPKRSQLQYESKKFPFFTVPFVAQWYQSVPFRLYVPFRSVCSSALRVTLELETVARAVASSAKMTSKKPASAS